MKVKVISMVRGQVGLSMSAVDQTTGEDLQSDTMNASRLQNRDTMNAHGHNPTGPSSEGSSDILDRRCVRVQATKH